MWGVGGVLLFSVPPSALYWILGFLFVLFVLLNLRQSSELLNKAILKRIIIVYVAVFTIAFTLFLAFPSHRVDKIRVGILPAVDPISDRSAFSRSAAICEMANQTLARIFRQDSLVYSLDWIWEAIATDSLQDRRYIQDFSGRILLDFVVLGWMENDTTFNWQVFDVHNKTIIAQNAFSRRESLLDAGQELARQILTVFKRDHELPSLRSIQDSVLVSYALGLCVAGQGEYREAISLAEKAFALDTLFIPNRNLLARANLERGIKMAANGQGGNIQKFLARSLAERTVKLDSSDAEATRLLGKYALVHEMWGIAEKYFKKASALNPHNARVYFDMSRLHKSRMKSIGFGGTEDLLRYAIELNPCYEEARLYLADYLYFNKWPSRAQREIRALLDINPRSVNGLMFLGKMAVAGGDIQKIIPIYEKLLQIAPENPDVYYNLGVFYFNIDDRENAERFFLKAIELGNQVDAYLYMGYICQARGEIDKAVEYYRLRIRHKRGLDDRYADEARKQLYNLTKPDSSIIKTLGAK